MRNTKETPSLHNNLCERNKNLENHSFVIFILITSLTLFFRFYHLATLSAWLRNDDAIMTRAAADLAKHWSWKLRLTGLLNFPLDIWANALFFKIMTPSLFSAWFYSATIGSLSVGMAYLAARQFFSKGASLLGTLLFAGSFWPAFISRFPQDPNMAILFEMLVLLVLGLLLNAQKKIGMVVYAVLLGLVTGAAAYTYAAILAIPPLIVLAVFIRFGRGAHRNYWVWGSFLGALILITMPLFFDLILHGVGNYYQSLFHNGLQLSAKKLILPLSFVTSVFVGCLQAGDYQPILGAFLSPVLAAFFLIGLVQVFKTREQPISRWIFLAFVTSFVPALLTNTGEYQRIAITVPFVFIICMIGASRLFESTPSRKHLWLYALILLSVSWDGYRLLMEYPKEWATPSTTRWLCNIKSIRSWRAFGALNDAAEKVGPGCYLGNLSSELTDQSLSIATYPFNTALNPQYGFSDSKWIAIITNLHYKPFLQARFPRAYLYDLDLEGTEHYGGDVLFIAPITGNDQKTFAAWYELNQRLNPATEMIITRSESGPRTQILEELMKQSALINRDPLLESCLLEEMYTQLNYEISWDKVKAEDNLAARVNVLRRAVALGYPMAHLLNELGNLYWQMGHVSDAKLAFQKAIQASINKTQAKEHLRLLEESLKPIKNSTNK